MVTLEQLGKYSLNLSILAFFTMLIAIALTPFGMGDALPVNRVHIILFLAATSGLSLAVYLAGKLFRYGQEKRRKTTETNSITEITRKRP